MIQTLKKAFFLSVSAVAFIVGVMLLFQLRQPVQTKQQVQISDSVIAVIGDSYITVSELRQAIETAHPVLKQGRTVQEQLSSVLAALAAEKTIAQEAMRLNFQSNARLLQLRNEFLRNAVIERVITTDVDAKITVSDDEANVETMKSLVTFKFRFWMEPTRERAEQVRRMMQTRGYESTVLQLVRQNPELDGITPQLESGYVRWTEIAPEFYEAIKSLPTGEISVPIKYDSAFYLLQIVDIRRSGMTTTQAVNAIPTSKKIIAARKRQAARTAYVAALMEPKNVRTNASSLQILVGAMEEWISSPNLNSMDFFSAVEKANGAHPKLLAYKNGKDRMFVTTTDKQFTLDEIARVLPLRKIMKEFKRPLVASAAYTAAAVRDHYLNQIGTERNYGEAQETKEQLRVWHDKWLYEEYRLKSTLQKSTGFGERSEQEVRQYIVKKDQLFLLQKIHAFVEHHQPQFNRSVLDTLRLNDPAVSRNMPVSFVRGGTDLPAFPMVGNEWRNDIPKLKTIFGLP